MAISTCRAVILDRLGAAHRHCL